MDTTLRKARKATYRPSLNDVLYHTEAQSMERTGNQIFIKPSLEEVDNTIQKMEERFGSAVSRFRERKGKRDNQKKKSHGCRKTSRAQKIFPSADLELDKERSGELFTLSVLLHTG